jgi:phospholipid/cholesterol/gamma-HCH transport system ATP-binding protein
MTDDTTNTAIRFENVSKAFGDHTILDDVTFSVPRGQTTAIIGHSGAGKSVILKHMVGLMQPDAGSVFVLGCDMAKAPQSEVYATRKRMGMLFQNGALFDSMTVGENVAFPLAHHNPTMSASELEGRVESALAEVELPDIQNRPVVELSGGQRKRVGLARALITRPEVVLFDEPNSGLDPVTSQAIDELTIHLKGLLGISFVIISHDIVGTLKVADRVGMLYQGKLIEYHEVNRFIQSKNPVVKSFLQRNVRLPQGDLPELADILSSKSEAETQ